MRFSERIGKKEIRSILQVNSIDDILLNGLWNYIQICYWEQKFNDKFFYTLISTDKIFLKKIWIQFFNNKLDEFPNGHISTLNGIIKKFFFESEWFEVFDFIEFIANNYPDIELNKSFVSWCNSVLEKEMSAYRFVNFKIAQITSENEIDSIENTLNNTLIESPVKMHFDRALKLLSDRENPDYRNSIKESISAVESFCCILLKEENVTLGQALKKIDSLHPSLTKGFSNIYGYTSSADGIRHGMLEKNNLGKEDAIYMSVSCSAFVNYLTQKDIKS